MLELRTRTMGMGQLASSMSKYRPCNVRCFLYPLLTFHSKDGELQLHQWDCHSCWLSIRRVHCQLWHCSRYFWNSQDLQSSSTIQWKTLDQTTEYWPQITLTTPSCTTVWTFSVSSRQSLCGSWPGHSFLTRVWWMKATSENRLFSVFSLVN